MWFMLCGWPRSPTADLAKFHLCIFIRHGPYLSESGLAETMCDEC